MTTAAVRPDLLYAWHGPAPPLTNTHGACGRDQQLSGFYYHEARFLRSLALRIDDAEPWLCEAASIDPATLALTFVHPEIAQPGGGGTGQSGDEEGVDAHGIPERSLDVRVTYRVNVAALDIAIAITNRARRSVAFDAALILSADFADIQEAQSGCREQVADVTAAVESGQLQFSYDTQQRREEH